MAQKATSRSVGRPREFDEEAALEAAMDAFWAKGYEATSMADLCNCTGLHKGSLYQAFGDNTRDAGARAHASRVLATDSCLHSQNLQWRV